VRELDLASDSRRFLWETEDCYGIAIAWELTRATEQSLVISHVIALGFLNDLSSVGHLFLYCSYHSWSKSSHYASDI